MSEEEFPAGMLNRMTSLVKVMARLEEEDPMAESLHRMYEHLSQAEAKAADDKARRGASASIGMSLMNSWNHCRRYDDPAERAVMGHSVEFGYEFLIERDGVPYVVSVKRREDT